MSDHAEITVTVKGWDEERVVEADASHAVARAVFTAAYAGDLTGESTTAIMLSYVAGDPSDPRSLEGPYTGYEQVTGTLAGRTGTFVFAVRGAHTGEVARTDVEIVEGSGTGELAGLRGRGGYAAGDMTYTLELDYQLDDELS